MSKTNVIVAAFINADPDQIKVTIDRDATPPEGIMTIPTEDGKVEVSLTDFDNMYKGFVRLWPVVKPLKTELLGLVREHSLVEKRAAKEAALAEKKAAKAAEKAERDAKREADKQAKLEAKAKLAKDKADKEAKAKADKEAKEKAAKEAKAKADKEAKAKAKKEAAAKK